MNTKYLLALLALCAFGCSDLDSAPGEADPVASDWEVSEAVGPATDERPLERDEKADAPTQNDPDHNPADEKADAPIDPAQFEREVIEWVNEVRASGAECGEHGTFLPAQPMVANAQLAAAAKNHSRDMARTDSMAHEGSDGSRFWNRATAAGYQGTARGENVAVGYPNPEEVVRAWLESDGHCMVIMLPETNEMGVGYQFRDNTRYGHFWTMVTGIH